jgi:class 3 adenylate cyclase
LFTDVEGSTRRWEADAEGMRVALAAHDEVLRRAIEQHAGWPRPSSRCPMVAHRRHILDACPLARLLLTA